MISMTWNILQEKNLDFCKIIEYLGTCSYYKLVIIN